MNVILSADLIGTPRKRGRPSGPSQFIHLDGLRLHDFAFMRAVAEGVDVVSAARRYLPVDQVDASAAGALEQALRARMVAQLQGRGENDLAKALAKVSGTSSDGTGEEAESLEAFAEQFDADMYSERELQELFLERQQQAAGRRGSVERAEQIRALDHLQSLCAVRPTPQDHVGQWFSTTVARRLVASGMPTLFTLVDGINARGRLWHRGVPGLGADRAKRLVEWLLDHQSCLGVTLSARVLQGLCGVHAVCPSVPVTGVGRGMSVVVATPTRDQLDLRAGGANALGASTDAQALKAWLDTLTLRSTHTQRAYRRDVERLLWWANEQGKSLAGLTVQDALEHVRFLENPPSHWINPLPSRRDAVDWAPMRGPLGGPAIQRALAAINNLYGFLVQTHYLLANPFAYLGHWRAPKRAPDALRGLSRSHIELMQCCLHRMPENPAKRRLVALLALLETTGVRLSELSASTWGDIQLARSGDGECQVLKVMGKGRVERLVPLKPSVLTALRAHAADRPGAAPRAGLFGVPGADAPLISVLGGAFGRSSDQDADSAQVIGSSGALSVAGVHRVLKGFFRQVANSTSDPQLGGTFQRASCHWLRHTFAHEVLQASQGDLPAVQQLLGHSSIATTGIYVTADMASRARAIAAMPDLFSFTKTT